MPPPVPSESESESDYESHDSDHLTPANRVENLPAQPPAAVAGAGASEGSDGGSDESDDSDASMSDAAAAISASRVPRLGSAQRPGNHVTGKLVNRAKRKAESDSGTSLGRAAKTRRRTGPSESQTPPSSDSDSDDDDIPNIKAEPARPLVVADEVTTNGSTTKAALHPSFPRTVRSFIRELFPHLEPSKYSAQYMTLSNLPVKRIPAPAPSFTDHKPQNALSLAMQAAGDLVPEHERCAKCARGSGIYSGVCVVVRDPAVLKWTGGSCANCYYNRHGCLCSLRRQTTSAVTTQDVDSPTSEQPAAKQTPVPVPQIPASAPAPLHPSYVASLASAAVSATPAHSKTTSVAQRSHDENLRNWEARYDSMSVDELMTAQAHLLEWQQNLTVRLVAMNHAVLKRLKAKKRKPS
ncbi:d063680d-8317-4bf1-bfc3-d4c6a98823ea [Thermothielavioides terrestris]|uniref:D063680d-8317-4bf1-bfc3-d4c6a98823ea n=1 Tax=Thermothielavioides terrestris TaxID=2587410 RepID=A0A446BLT7_9PEZI|nr:d063680d-8317-4bf1-bfc3-d4c6a98823ea [Thermothielavioides terrestris]